MHRSLGLLSSGTCFAVFRLPPYVAFGCRHFDMLPGAYGIHSQIWDTFLAEFGSVGTTHVVGVAGGPH